MRINLIIEEEDNKELYDYLSKVAVKDRAKEIRKLLSQVVSGEVYSVEEVDKLLNSLYKEQAKRENKKVSLRAIGDMLMEEE